MRTKKAVFPVVEKSFLESNESAADLFYMIFFDQSPEARRYFVNVNMGRQAVLLTMALQMVVQYYLHTFPAMKAYLKILGDEHSHRKIGPELYPKFREALLTTLSRFHDQDWDEKLGQQWQKALELASETMLAGYADLPQLILAIRTREDLMGVHEAYAGESSQALSKFCISRQEKAQGEGTVAAEKPTPKRGLAEALGHLGANASHSDLAGFAKERSGMELTFGIMVPKDDTISKVSGRSKIADAAERFEAERILTTRDG